MITQIIYYILIGAFTLIVHELGHVLAIKKYTGKFVNVYFKKGQFVVGDKEDYDPLSNQEYRMVMFWGIAAGLVVIAFTLKEFVLLIGFIAYVVGCNEDIQYLIKGKESLK